MAASSTPTAGEAARQRAAEFLLRRHHFIWPEALPWLLAIAAFFAFPDRMTIGTQVLIMIMFALSLDLILGYAGIITLGHAAFFGIGAYTVGLGLARLGWSEPISGLASLERSRVTVLRPLRSASRWVTPTGWRRRWRRARPPPAGSGTSGPAAAPRSPRGSGPGARCR